MADTHPSYFGSEAHERFQQMNADIFRVEAQAKALGFEEVRLALYRARCDLGQAENRYRRDYTTAREAAEAHGVPASRSEPTPPRGNDGGEHA